LNSISSSSCSSLWSASISDAASAIGPNSSHDTCCARSVASTGTRRRSSRRLSDFNPTNWAVIAGRGASSAHPDWGLIASRAGFLALLLLACLAFATRAFRSYQRGV
jgi:hypothetical protein